LELWYAAYVWLTIRRKRFAPDLIIAVFPPVLFFCLAKLLPGCRKVGIVHDFQGILGFSGEGRLSRATQFIVKRVESIAFRYCDRIIVLSESMARLAHKEYGIMEQKIQVAYPFVAITAEKRGRNKLGSILPSGVRHVVYSGALGKKQEPRKLYDFFCAAALRIPNARFHIFSEGPEFDNLRERHTSEPVKGVELHDLVGEEDLAELYDRSTIQVIPVAEGLSEACLPSKLPNIIASGCALFAICDEGSELANIVAKYGGMSVPRWDEHALIGSMIKFLNEIGRESSEMRRAKTAGLLKEQFSLDRLLNSVLHSPATLGVKIS
jgi:glycosyltransferase involved in cell wall biosynthesis